MKHAAAEPAIATPYDTRVHFLTRAKRMATPLRRDFVQKPRSEEVRPSVLSTFVKNRDHRGLLAYLFILAVTSKENADGWTTRLDSRVWARCFGTTENTSSDAASLGAVSKILHRLEGRRLIQVQRVGRSEAAVTLLREDGSGQPYTRPGLGNKDAHIQLPHEFWTNELDARLKLPGLAMLLVLMCEPAWFGLASERYPAWYGWSADTAERGYKELLTHQLAEFRERIVKAPAAPLGYTKTHQYKLAHPFRHAPSKGGSTGRPNAVPAGGKEVGNNIEQSEPSTAASPQAG
ncbi:hypothetical protein [Planomonospora parontospora]|uniref:hypothetical protein n=1 Tax=Planomonospora parontospora TaxID=58119 RepID=UPI00167136F4|nr:hypothetical protein [Planomonospora parontospora]GGL56466.1 hypothetical protein GCM10014719_67390 [Planomonospora parontospora subsp. antibiotica]GII19929.1 hypothetical protein Ppa05_66550 [Planomonospora parontospora subsp. antibiotica]